MGKKEPICSKAECQYSARNYSKLKTEKEEYLHNNKIANSKLQISLYHKNKRRREDPRRTELRRKEPRRDIFKAKRKSHDKHCLSRAGIKDFTEDQHIFEKKDMPSTEPKLDLLDNPEKEPSPPPIDTPPLISELALNLSSKTLLNTQNQSPKKTLVKDPSKFPEGSPEAPRSKRNRRQRMNLAELFEEEQSDEDLKETEENVVESDFDNKSVASPDSEEELVDSESDYSEEDTPKKKGRKQKRVPLIKSRRRKKIYQKDTARMQTR
ncbi:unnamed protein product [Moneuplotes crassus]|uniref:Uncharacterized protein n=1 Tax=Euplotes crassus TaxID=5936 RepID=A0AAD1UQH7_EUPCR|nr:unnamed protein product [Moneuplotes crassus]